LVVWFLLAAGVGALIWFDPVGKRRRAPGAGSGGDRSAVVATTEPGDAGSEAGGSLDDAGPSPASDALVSLDAAAPFDAPAAANALYTIPEALDDLAASPLAFIGTGEWFGNASIHACAYRNDRVIVVNVYCTRKETPALGLIVLSPARGRVRIYVEDDAAISTLKRKDYQTFRAEAQPPLDADPPRLDFTYAELNAWEERRYHAGQGACWLESGYGDCSDRLAVDASGRAAWSASTKTFLADPPESWYALTKDLHGRATRDLRAKH
jgi:hypothetical protein